MDYLHPTYALAKKIHKLRRKYVFKTTNPNPSASSSHLPSIPSSSSSSSHQFPFTQKWQPSSNNLIDGSFLPLNPPPNQQQQHTFFKTSSAEENLHIVDGSTGTSNNNFAENLINSFSKNNTSSSAIMWPYQSYKPISWDKYYAHDMQDKHVSITSGLAAGITIGVFFAVFLLTFGCRLYSQRSDSRHRSQNSSPRRRLSVSDLLGWPSPTPCHPPPPYEIAIQMPAPCSTTTLSTLVTTPCEPPAPTYEDSCRHGSPSSSSHSISPFFYPTTTTIMEQQQSSPQRLQLHSNEIRTV